MTVSKLSPGIMCKKSSENSWEAWSVPEFKKTKLEDGRMGHSEEMEPKGKRGSNHLEGCGSHVGEKMIE